MKKKANSKNTNEISNKLSDLKRKRITRCHKNDIQNKNKSITEFISIDKNILPANSYKNAVKFKKNCINSENKNKNNDLRLSFAKNKNSNQMFEKTIFNENFISQLNDFLVPFLNIMKNSLINAFLKDFSFLKLTEEEINKFFDQNMTNLLIKFILQLSKNFLFIPKTFENEKYFEKEKIKLFNGFDETKYITFKYDAIKSSEVNLYIKLDSESKYR